MHTAYELYNEMLDSYWRFAKNGEDSDSCYKSFLLAAISLAKLNEPNPFPNEELHVNSAIKPGNGPRVVTSAIE